jgi:hypothetical protein
LRSAQKGTKLEVTEVAAAGWTRGFVVSPS